MFSSQSDRGRRRSRRDRYDDRYDDGYDSYDDYDQSPSPKAKSRSRGPSTRNGKIVKQQTYVETTAPVEEKYALTRTRGRSLDPANAAVGRPVYVQRRESYSVSPPPPYRRASSRGSSRRNRSETRRDRYEDIERDNDQWKNVLGAGARAAALQAFRLRKEPGTFTDKPKLARIGTAALGAAAIEYMLERNADDPDKHRRRRMWEASIGGAVISRVVHGPRSELRRQYD